ncbi:hypothetical protein H6F86_01100 [Phormidium sp. FACHB-592]|uniref:Uncharacterized protein n=1 Tax=Stenomitos frigidus AS-A4 TaxID=2933935 RepID=A0ABV0KN35_9CYAN|nr:hypothetical protein [Phormidium sp. FACHB-592]MBD2072532.1 hypothetical protein [Phormidium sp. FACHB-592]
MSLTKLYKTQLIYVIEDDLQQIAILAIRKPTPYDYDNLDALLNSLE